jgi:hypothetical protein
LRDEGVDPIAAYMTTGHLASTWLRPITPQSGLAFVSSTFSLYLSTLIGAPIIVLRYEAEKRMIMELHLSTAREAKAQNVINLFT